MNRTLIGLAALLALSGAAQADSMNFYECLNGKQRFSNPSESRKEARDPDPVTHIMIRTRTEDTGEKHMAVTHVLRSGREIDRIGQYPTNGLSATENSWIWRGVYDRDPSITMTGSLRRDVRDITYTETRFRDGKWEWSNTTSCHKVNDFRMAPEGL